MQRLCGFGRAAVLPVIGATFLLLAARPVGATHIDTDGALPDEGRLMQFDDLRTGSYGFSAWGDGVTRAFDPVSHRHHHFREGGWIGTDGFHHHHHGVRTVSTPEAPTVVLLGLGLTALLLGARTARRRAT